MHSVSAKRRRCRDYLLFLPEDCTLQMAGEWYHCVGKQLRSYDSRQRLISERLPGLSVPKGKTEPHTLQHKIYIFNKAEEHPSLQTVHGQSVIQCIHCILPDLNREI